MRYLFALAAVVAFAVPAAAAAASHHPPSPNQLAVQACKQQVAALGRAAFREAYGANAYGKCVAQAVRAARQQLSNAARDCRAERADTTFASTHGGKTFAEFYGANANDRNAFGKCVATKAKAAVRANTKAVATAAKACKAERSANRSQFRATYGLGPNKVAAFARCVKAKLNAAP